MKRPDVILRRRSRGITLVELMIAVALSIVLLGGTIAIFLSSKQAYRTQEDLARIQENLRYGIGEFIREISPAGYMGCAGSVQKANTKVTDTTVAGDFTSLISGEEGTGVNGSDKLTLRFALPASGIPVTTAMAGQTGDVVVDPNDPAYAALNQNDVVAVSDCDAIAVFKITNDPASAAGSLVHGEDLQHVFGSADWASAMVYRLDGVSFEVDKVTNGGRTTSSLYATRLGGNRELILPGVEDFQIEYGIDLAPRDGTADRYLPWDQVPAAQVNDITSLHIRMTVNPGLPVPGTTGIHPEFRKKAEFTVKLRNRNGDA